MSTTYKVVSGDTFEKIARRVYGTGEEASRIQRSNPGVEEPLSAGTTLLIPDLTIAPRNQPPVAPSVNPDEVAVIIEGERFRFWTELQIRLSIDSFSRIEFTLPFDSSRQDLRDIFRPFTFKSVEVTVGGEVLFTGVMVNVNPILKPDSKMLQIGCYARPGVFMDCTAPASAYPLESNNLRLDAVARSLADPFGIPVSLVGDAGPVFRRIAHDPHKKILPFLTDLAKQRGFVMSDTAEGELLFWKSITSGTPVATFVQGVPPFEGATPVFDGQKYYSHVTGTGPVFIGGRGKQYTVINPHLRDVLRPMTVKFKDALVGDEKLAAEAAIARMFANIAGFEINLPTWRDPEGNLWEPNTTLDVTAPDAMIYNSYEFLIRNVTLKAAPESRTVTLDIVIPGAFNSTIPEKLPWDD